MQTLTSPNSSGPDRQTRVQTVLIAFGLFVCSAGFLAGVKRADWTVFLFLRLEYLAIGLLAGCAVLAAHDHNLRRVWLFTFALAAGFGIHLVGMGITGEMPGILFRVVWASIVGLATAAIFGTLGGLLGLVLQRISASVTRGL
jgi:peptidoglycan/LPS O-acetylase OafA/YrhL